LTIRQSTFHEKHTRINHRGVHWSTIMDSPASLLPSGTHNPSSGWLIAESQSTDRTWHETIASRPLWARPLEEPNPLEILRRLRTQISGVLLLSCWFKTNITEWQSNYHIPLALMPSIDLTFVASLTKMSGHLKFSASIDLAHQQHVEQPQVVETIYLSRDLHTASKVRQPHLLR
jgi:hypothetical protein